MGDVLGVDTPHALGSHAGEEVTLRAGVVTHAPGPRPCSSPGQEAAFSSVGSGASGVRPFFSDRIAVQLRKPPTAEAGVATVSSPVENGTCMTQASAREQAGGGRKKTLWAGECLGLVMLGLQECLPDPITAIMAIAGQHQTDAFCPLPPCLRYGGRRHVSYMPVTIAPVYCLPGRIGCGSQIR